MEDATDVQLMKHRMFAGLRSEFHGEMNELRDELSENILNTSRQLVSDCALCCVLG